jgi:undecaprenyl-diphosphatase
MEIMQAIILGVVEGLTEFLPVSSTGHLIVAEEFIGYKDTSKMFTVVIQMGAIAAVIWYYRRQLWQLIMGLKNGREIAGNFLLTWIIATIPAAIIGLLLDEKLEKYAVPLTVAIALIAGGIIIWLVETYHRAPPAKEAGALEKISLKQAFLIGIYQITALIPGVSRSGATILGGMLSGLDRVTATAFSFYLSIPILLLAGGYKLLTSDVSTVSGGSTALIAGLISAFVTALVVVTWLLRYVSRHDFKIFAYYRIIFGGLLLVLIGAGWLG